MRVGTWNLAGRWSTAHAAFLLALDCEVLLLTEVPRVASLSGYASHATKADMAGGRAWAAVWSRAPLEALEDPHAASALAVVDGTTYCSSVLPWHTCGDKPWGKGTHAERMRRALEDLAAVLTPATVWGGDFNQSLEGRDYAGSSAGRATLQELIRRLDLDVPTAALSHQIDGHRSIDHIAVPAHLGVAVARRHAAGSLSDHDAYTVGR
ncbi:endonuclease/exonuclease/phosphatase family protein [Nocardioides mesophilus]|uniref:Endonuclease/exonuclease/phosphatase family protein n=1 Tax=Nocardioides mesophilus TaxID=433659 RepID=A0A7G9R9P9_9ACTN|nr:endonuclease/exonuclease/phosphatase family protein [Nocardioides mesophilus]QNN52324.1 endonuclease/exonuclease/phosphatase family protein [Nocardioides mesophilus]